MLSNLVAQTELDGKEAFGCGLCIPASWDTKGGGEGWQINLERQIEDIYTWYNLQ